MPEEDVRDGKFGWRGWLGVLAGLAGLGVILLAMAGLIRLFVFIHPSPHATPRPTVSHLSNRDYGYWFCWDTGSPRPHHLGAGVQGDHLCSESELQQATDTP